MRKKPTLEQRESDVEITYANLSNAAGASICEQHTKLDHTDQRFTRVEHESAVVSPPVELLRRLPFALPA